MNDMSKCIQILVENASLGSAMASSQPDRNRDGAASPVRRVEDLENAVLRDTIREIIALFPDFLDGMSDDDREALLNAHTETRDDLRSVLPDFKQMIQVRNTYVEGFIDGTTQIMSDMMEYLVQFAERLDEEAAEEQMNHNQNTENRNSVVLENGVSEMDQPCSSRSVMGSSRNTLADRTNHITDEYFGFWYPPPIIEFESETRPLEWCNEVHCLENRESRVESKRYPFHGKALIQSCDNFYYQIPSFSETELLDPRLPASER